MSDTAFLLVSLVTSIIFCQGKKIWNTLLFFFLPLKGLKPFCCGLQFPAMPKWYDVVLLSGHNLPLCSCSDAPCFCSLPVGLGLRWKQERLRLNKQRWEERVRTGQGRRFHCFLLLPVSLSPSLRSHLSSYLSVDARPYISSVYLFCSKVKHGN